MWALCCPFLHCHLYVNESSRFDGKIMCIARLQPHISETPFPLPQASTVRVMLS